jgi:branched-chain amino acid transport system substrate-binding protein
VPNGAWYPGIKATGEASFETGYVAKYGGSASEINSDTAQSYSVMQVLEQAVNKTNSVDNAKLMDELRTDTFQTLQGPVKFTSDGQNSLAVAFLYQWQKGTIVPVFPPQAAQADPEYPKPMWP